MTKPNKRPRLELRTFIDRALMEQLQQESREQVRSITGQITIILSERYKMELVEVVE